MKQTNEAPRAGQDLKQVEERMAGLIEQAVAPALIDPVDIPKIDLYMEQVTSFFDDMLQDSCRSTEEKIFTKTMINNYTKEGTLPRPANKKYNREHIIKLVYIFILKQTMTMQDIKSMMEMADRSEGARELYDAYLELLDEEREDYREQLRRRSERVERKLHQKGMDDPDSYAFLYLMQTLSSAMSDKLLAGRFLDDMSQPKKEKE
ncbi:MAG: DUF1836 domain-containing protein [Eubacteriales bacterium]|nr:DUF1836 domain-containing protein [Eubacteriales bacterium]